MNIIQNFKISNSLKALAGMVVLGAFMLVMGAQSSLAIWLMSTVTVVIVAKFADVFSTKQETSAQAEESAFQQANIASLADYRDSKVETKVAA